MVAFRRRAYERIGGGDPGRTAAVWITAAAATTVGCCALSLLPLQRVYYYHTTSSTTSLWGSSSTNLADLLPSDLDDAWNNASGSSIISSSSVNYDHARVLNALGVQLLLFSGWAKQTNGKQWHRDISAYHPLSLQQRLDRITPAWKSGGMLDYTFDHAPPNGIFGHDNILMHGSDSCCQSVAELAHHLEDEIGLSVVDDLDGPARAALKAMLSWRIHAPNGPLTTVTLERKEPTLLLVFSFDATPACRSVDDCPLPGPTNELLAATAAQFVNSINNHDIDIRIIAQWEVAAALQHIHSIAATPVGTPGTFQNTAEIFDLMHCEWRQHNTQETIVASTAILLAHPDHLRRVLWTAQTILKKHQQKQNQHSVRSSQHLDNCIVPPSTNRLKLHLIPAMNPIRLDWTNTGTHVQSPSAESTNMFDCLAEAMVHTHGEQVSTHWYDNHHWGFFPDADPQKWTHRREVWLLYDHWAVAKGLVTGTIDFDVIFESTKTNGVLPPN